MGSLGFAGASNCTMGGAGLTGWSAGGGGGAGAGAGGVGGVGLSSVVVHPVSHKEIMQANSTPKTGFRRWVK